MHGQLLPVAAKRGPRPGGSRPLKCLPMVKYQIIGNAYICTTIDAETACQKAEMLLSNTVRNKQEREKRVQDLRRWCRTAKPGDSNIQDEFTVILQAKLKR